MRLGLSQACYRWVIYPHLRRDQAAYLYGARPLPYLQTIRPLAPAEDPADYLLDRMAELGIPGLYLVGSWLKDQSGAEAFRRQVAARGMFLVGGIGLNVAAASDEWRATEFDAVVAQMRLCSWGGATVAAAVHNQPNRHNHFTTDPPIGGQIERISRNFRSLVPVCEELGLTLAFENHADYRLREIVAVIETVGSPWIRINIDTANPIAVIEDPLEAARTAARYAVMLHIKDHRIQPATGTGEPRVFWAPLGQGSVPIPEILAVIAAEAPDPKNLVACLEVAPPPEHDPHLWLQSSLAWLRAQCGHYFETGVVRA
ncbi:MAG: sugar phosphate isomerase/epimerase [Actinobacteria bacterium]|nr:sugar phosphate isomerase/epimerase [Actinomycetota bacterium]